MNALKDTFLISRTFKAFLVRIIEQPSVAECRLDWLCVVHTIDEDSGEVEEHGHLIGVASHNVNHKFGAIRPQVACSAVEKFEYSEAQKRASD